MFKTLLQSLALLLGLTSCYGAISNSLGHVSSLDLHECTGNQQFLCGNLQAPLDYTNPQLGTIELPVSIHKASQKSHGYLLFNFGGPWADDVKILPSMVAKRFTTTMLQDFDIVVINPRGANPNIPRELEI